MGPPCIWKLCGSLTTSQSRKLIRKTDLKLECPYYYALKNLERFGQYLKKSKNGFPSVISNLARKGSGVYFHAGVLIFSPNALY